MPESHVYSVTQLTKSIRQNLLANNAKLVGVWIEGEVSGNKIYGSGHRYFTLKDKDASINCVLFAFHVGGCDENYRAALAQGEDKVNGLKVQVQGELDLNMTRGQYSYKVTRIRLAGLGDKMAQFNALKAKLEAEGLNKLDHPEKRRPLPFLPRRIGIITSPSGAVIHDMYDVINRRFPNVEIRLYPAKVQGEGAAETLVAGLRFFNGLLVQHDAGWVPDVLILARGGGSVEDLWTFNEEPVVRAVAESAIPIISAVGHESDTTLCDYVADLRAGTPSIAAERVVPEKAKLLTQVTDLAARLEHAVRASVEEGIQQVDYLSFRLTSAPQKAVTQVERTLTNLTHRLSVAPQGSLARTERTLTGLSARLLPAVQTAVSAAAQRVERASLRLEPPIREAVHTAEAKLANCRRALELLNPYQVLERGYSITMDANGHVLRSANDVAAGTHLKTRLKDGIVESVAVEKGQSA